MCRNMVDESTLYSKPPAQGSMSAIEILRQLSGKQRGLALEMMVL